MLGNTLSDALRNTVHRNRYENFWLLLDFSTQVFVLFAVSDGILYRQVLKLVGLHASFHNVTTSSRSSYCVVVNA